MTVKDVVELSAVYLQLEDILSENDFTSSINANTNPVVVADDLTERNINLLIRCTDLVLNEIASDYVFLTKTEEITSANTEIQYSSFSESVYKIKIIEKNGVKIKFKPYPTFVEVDKPGTFNITYNYLPETKNALSSTCDEFANVVSLRIIAYGVASEYCYISGMFNEGAMWENKFKNSLTSIHLSHNKQIKARRWS